MQERLDDLLLEDIVGEDAEEYLKINDPEYVIAKEISKARRLLERIDNSVVGLDLKELQMLKGDRGDTGESGKTPEKFVDYLSEEETNEIIDYLESKIIQPEDGKTPVKGEDYFTEADKQEIRKIILKDLPTADEILAKINSTDGSIKSNAVEGLDKFMVESVTKFAKAAEKKTPGVNPFTQQPYYQVSASGGAGSTSPLTTKGDLYTYDTAGTRLGVGTDGQILIADSTQATGLRWGKIGLNYLGTWNATTNTPTIVSGTGVGGDYYIVSVAGTTSIDGITDWEIGDWIIFNDETSTWQKIDNSEAWLQVTEWAAATPVKANQIQTQDGRLIQRITAGTTGATFDATEAGLYTLINLGTPKAFVGGKFYYATEQATIGTRLLSRNANGVSNGAFTNAEAALWTLLSNPVPSVWASTNYEYQGEQFTVGTRIVVRTAASGVSGLTFNATESSNYELIKPLEIASFQASTLYYKDEKFTDNGVVYRRYFTGDSAATFTGTELDNWSIDSYDNLSINTPSQTRTAATFTVGYSDGELLLQPAGATQVITFDNIATPEGKEFGFNGTVDSTKLITWTTAGGLTIEDPVTHLPVASFNNSTWIDNAEFSFQVIRAGNVLRLRGI